MYAVFDIDDVLANTVPAWLKKYLKKYNHNLKKEDILDWDIAKYTVPECGNNIYNFLNSKTFYNSVKPIPLALKGVNTFRELGLEIVYATGGSPKASVYKFDWLQKNGFWQKQDHYVQTSSKFLLRGEILIDDNYDNVAMFNKHSGYGLLYNAPWNSQCEYPNRVSGWKEIMETIDRYQFEVRS